MSSADMIQQDRKAAEIDKVDIHSSFSPDDDEDDLWHVDDGPSCGDPFEEADNASDLEREWKRRHDQFHNMGYRDGLIAGKESSAQKGFNAGFIESVYIGYKWGVLRGVIGTLACLPPELQERLITEEIRMKFHKFQESLQPVSAVEDALKMFSESHLSKRSAGEQKGETVESSDGCFHNYQCEFESLICELPAVNLLSKANY
ncbi:unnamed protein product [Cuscuta europaea]|uniref:Essential protein Yae1 N-terminal domain-containing protein n=1 Tax=Cuscuta europaea TaxID=41803 RepID=A0A9P1EBH0_CUSEU|nr:unnamed protein product [Cuscuta europaea]